MASVWEIKDMPEFAPLEEDIEADVCIIGGGLAGVWSAYLLSKEGKRVALLESDKLGRSATLYTTAFITELVDTPFDELAKMFDARTAELVRKSGVEAIELIERTVNDEGIDCDFSRTTLEVYKDLKHLGGKPEERYERQAKYHPMKFLKGLAEAAQKQGARLFEGTEALEITARGSAVHVLAKNGKSVNAKDVIVATYEPFNNPKPTHFKKGMYMSYVYALEMPQGSLPEGLYLDQHNPYHYVRVDNEEDRQTMIVGGEDHRAELGFEKEQSFRALKEFIEETFPGLEYKVTHKWRGGILEPSDGLPLIGEYASHEYVVAAFSGNGMTYSAISGRILTDLILGHSSIYKEIYDPARNLEGRALLYKFRDYAGEFFGGAVKNLFK